MKKVKISTTKQKLNFWIKTALLLITVFFFVAVVKMNMQINDIKSVLDKTKNEYYELELDIEKSKAEIASMPEDPENLPPDEFRKIAKKYGWLDSDTVIFATSQPN